MAQFLGIYQNTRIKRVFVNKCGQFLRKSIKRCPEHILIVGIEKDDDVRKIIWILLALLCMSVSCTETPSEQQEPARGGFFLKGRVLAVNDHIEIEVIESDYADGIYWVLTSDTTEYRAADGSVTSRSALAVGDIVEIEYGGQVMMSYPPQIVAARIRILARE